MKESSKSLAVREDQGVDTDGSNEDEDEENEDSDSEQVPAVRVSLLRNVIHFCTFMREENEIYFVRFFI